VSGAAVLIDGDASAGARLLAVAESAEALTADGSAGVVRWRGNTVDYLASGDARVLLGDGTVITDGQGSVEAPAAVVLLSAGAAAAVVEYAALSWPEFLEVLHARGPREVIALTRELERNDPDRTVWPRPAVHPPAAIVLLHP
jgi:hypothetical protein